MAYTPEEITAFKETIIDGLINGRSLLSMQNDKTLKIPSRATIYTWLNPEHVDYDQAFFKSYSSVTQTDIYKAAVRCRANVKGSRATTIDDYRVQNARKVNKAKKPDGFIYILQFGNENIFKFGASSNPDRRIKDIDSSSPVQINELGRFPFKNVYEIEECIHENIKNSMMRKEWFKMEKLSALALVEEIKEMSNEGFYLIRR